MKPSPSAKNSTSHPPSAPAPSTDLAPPLQNFRHGSAYHPPDSQVLQHPLQPPPHREDPWYIHFSLRGRRRIASRSGALAELERTACRLSADTPDVVSAGQLSGRRREPWCPGAGQASNHGRRAGAATPETRCVGCSARRRGTYARKWRWVEVLTARASVLRWKAPLPPDQEAPDLPQVR